MTKLILNTLVCLFFLGGLFGFVVALLIFFSGGSPAEYGVMGIGGGFWLLSCAITLYIREKLGLG